jgi:O-antigen ligase
VPISHRRLPRPDLESVLGLCVVLTLFSGAIEVPLYAALGIPPVLGAPFMAVAGAVGLIAAARIAPRFPVTFDVLMPVGLWMTFVVWAMVSATWSTAPDLVGSKAGLLAVSTTFLVLGICVGFSGDAADAMLRTIFAAGLVTAAAIFLFGNSGLPAHAGTNPDLALKTFRDAYQSTTQCVSFAAMAALIFLLRGSQNRLAAAAWGVAWFVLTVASLIGGGRGAAIGGVLAQMAVLVFAMAVFWRQPGSGRLLWAALAAPFLGAVLLMAGTIFEFRGVERLLKIANGLTDNTGRSGLWAAALRMADAHPIFGAGLASFEASANNIEGLGVYPHNIFLELLAETGLVGFALFTGAFVWAIASLARRARTVPFSQGALWLGLFVSTAFDANVSGSFTERYPAFIFGFGVGLAARFWRRQNGNLSLPPLAQASIQR